MFELILADTEYGSLELEVKDLQSVSPDHPKPERKGLEIHLKAGAKGFKGAVHLEKVIQLADENPWMLFPGFFYGKGRQDSRLAYPSLTEKPKPEQFKSEKEADPWSSQQWDFALDRGAYPMLLCRSGDRWQGLDWSPHYQILSDSDTVIQANPSNWGDSEPQIGLGFGWHSEGFLLRLNIPANEAPRRHARNRYDSATTRKLTLAPSQSLSFNVSLWDFKGDNHAYQQVLECVYTELSKQHAAADLEHADLEKIDLQKVPANHIELDEDDTVTSTWSNKNSIADCAAHGLLAWHWVEKPGYMVYTSAFDRSAEFNANNRKISLGWHFEALGFVGGFPVAFGLLWKHQRDEGQFKDGQNNLETKQENELVKQSEKSVSPLAHRAKTVAEKMLTRFCSEAISPSGFFKTSYHPGPAQSLNGAFANPAPLGSSNQDASGATPFYGSCWLGKQNLAHARTTADASQYLARVLGLLGPKYPRYEEWKHALKKSLDAVLRVQNEEGHFGQIYDTECGEVLQWQGDGGLLWIKTLDASYALFSEDSGFQMHLENAMEKAGRAYSASVRAEYICGAPEDVSLAPTSEDGYNAMLAYGALHRRFGGDGWKNLLIQTADWTLSWRKAYNVRFPKKNILGSADFRTSGGDFASSNNNHLHVYGMNCLAELYYIQALTGKAYYGQRAEDHFRFCCQLLCREDGQWNGQRGMCSEQFYTSDWSIWGNWDPSPYHVQKGSIMGFSHVWTVNMMLLGLEQIEQAKQWGVYTKA